MIKSFINNFPKESFEKTKTNTADYVNSDDYKFFSLNFIKYSKGFYFINQKKKLVHG